MKKFNIGVIGDTGYDVWTKYHEGFPSADDRQRYPQNIYDLDVPSGAEFTAQALRNVLTESTLGTRIKVAHITPDAILSQREDNKLVTTQPSIIFLKRYPSRGQDRGKFRAQRVTRLTRLKEIAELAPDGSIFNNLRVPDADSFRKDKLDLLVINDGDGRWREYCSTSWAVPHSDKSANSLLEGFLSRRAKKSPTRLPGVILNLHLSDEQSIKTIGTGAQVGSTSTWDILTSYADQVCVVCSANSLRRAGAAISRRLSFEQTVEDLVYELKYFPPLRFLSRFKHLIIRFGLVAAAHIITQGRDRTCDFVFAPFARDGIYRDPLEEGRTLGNNMLLTTGLVSAWLRRSPEQLKDVRECFIGGIKTGIYTTMKNFDSGYEFPIDAVKVGRVKNFFKHIAKNVTIALNDDPYGVRREEPTKNEYILGDIEVLQEVLEPLNAKKRDAAPWKILRQSIDCPLTGASASSTKVPARVSRINFGLAIAMFGHNYVLNHDLGSKIGEDYNWIKSILRRPEYHKSAEETPDYKTLSEDHLPETPFAAVSSRSQSPAGILPIYAPIMQFGKLTLIERHDIESLHSIRNLMKGYLENQNRLISSLRPISIAVFGSPGSGKSFAVKEMAKSINESLDDKSKGFEPIEYNVAQFRTVEDLGDALTRASSINNQNKVPLVFFDEFDCPFGGKPLGWLKYFLSPMQDGTFYAARQTVNMGRAVFVFAGGIYRTFERFNPFAETIGTHHLRRKTDELRKRVRLFTEQKGPDFVSRLRSHINISSIDERDGETKCVIRRSIALRGILEDSNLVARHDESGMSVATVDEDVLYGLLTVDRYRHGIRSMEAIIQMCTPIDGKVQKASLPSRAQLNMHVDADNFFIRMHRGRARSASNPDERGLRYSHGDNPIHGKDEEAIGNKVKAEDTESGSPFSSWAKVAIQRRIRTKKEKRRADRGLKKKQGPSMLDKTLGQTKPHISKLPRQGPEKAKQENKTASPNPKNKTRHPRKK